MSFTRKLRTALPLVLALFPAVDGVLRLLPASRFYHRGIALPTALLCLCVVFVSRRPGSSRHAIRYTLLGAGLLGIYFVLASYLLHHNDFHGAGDNSVIGFWLTETGEQELSKAGTRASLHSQTGPVGWEVIYSKPSQWCSLALLALFYGGSFVSLTYGFRILGASMQSSSPTPPVTPNPVLPPAQDQSAFTVFISYAHKDNKDPDHSNRWLDRLLEHIQPLVLQGQVSTWADKEIETGEHWHESIQAQLQNAKVAVLLISPAFLASKYIRNNELPALLMKARQEGLTVLPIILRPCMYSETKFKYPDPIKGPEEISLSTFQAANPPSMPLNMMEEHEQDQLFLSVAQTILRIAQPNA